MRIVRCAALVGLLACAVPALAQDSHYEQLANAPFPGGYPAKESVIPLENELFFQLASQAYIWSLPAINMWAMKEGSEKVFGAGYNVLPYWPKRLKRKRRSPRPTRMSSMR